MTEYDQAVEQLRVPATWCQGAAALAAYRDRRALVPLMQAYELPVEVSKVCLLDAMDTLGAVAGAHEMLDSSSPEDRRLALHLMELFPDEGYLPSLERFLNAPEPRVRAQALRSLTLQYQTQAWEALMIRMLEHPDESVRAVIIESLALRRTESAREALFNRLANESSEPLRKQLKQILELEP